MLLLDVVARAATFKTDMSLTELSNKGSGQTLVGDGALESTVSNTKLRVPERELSEFLWAHHLCDIANSPSFCRTPRVCPTAYWVLFSKAVLSEQYFARFLIGKKSFKTPKIVFWYFAMVLFFWAVKRFACCKANEIACFGLWEYIFWRPPKSGKLILSHPSPQSCSSP